MSGVETGHNVVVTGYLVCSSSTGRPGRFTPATTSSTTTGSPASTAWTAQVSKVDLQLWRDVIGWPPEVVLILCLYELNREERQIFIPASALFSKDSPKTVY